MHESSLIGDLIKKITVVAQEHDSARVAGVTVQLGALCHISADHFREHFVNSTRGTIAEGATLTIEENVDPSDEHAQDILLKSVEVEE